MAVTGLGWVSALGGHWPQNWQRLLRGEGAISAQQPFPDLPPRPLALVADQPQDLNRLLAQATEAALVDAHLTPPLPDMGVVVGSSRGYQGQWEAWGQGHREVPWLDTLPGSVAATVARLIQSHGPIGCPMAACATGLWAIAQGAALIQRGECDRVLVGAGEAAITPLTLIGFDRMGAMAPQGCYPFDQERQGLVLGEGAAMLVLESLTAARSRRAPCYGYVQGAGLTADGHHISAPHLSSGSGLAAIRQCLQRSSLTAPDIGFIHAHGTGTRLNDAYETALIQTLFPPQVAVTSTKGATGHTLGASGAMGAIICLLALHHQCLPPCVGLATPAFDLNFVRQATPAAIAAALCFSFGFGGQNAVVAFTRHPSP